MSETDFNNMKIADLKKELKAKVDKFCLFN